MPRLEKQRHTQPCGAAGRVSPRVGVTGVHGVAPLHSLGLNFHLSNKGSPEPDCLGSDLRCANYQLCDLGYVT